MPIYDENGHEVGDYDARAIRWDEYEGYIFESLSSASLHSALPHPISLVDSYVSFDLIIPSYQKLMDEIRNYDNTLGNAKYLVCLIGFNRPVIQFVFYHPSQNNTIMRIIVTGNDSGSYIELNVGYEETHHFDIILKDYTAEIIMDDETLEFSNNSDEPLSIVPVSDEQPYVFIGTWYLEYFIFILGNIHIETDTFLANSEIYDINYWLGEFETAYNEE